MFGYSASPDCDATCPPVSLAMAVLETPSSRKRQMSSSLPLSRETPSEPLAHPMGRL